MAIHTCTHISRSWAEIASYEHSVSISFHTFCRYFVPGLYVAFWTTILAIRWAHFNDVQTASQLLTFLYVNIDDFLPIVFALGFFIGFCLVGIGPYVQSVFSTRLIHGIHRYFLTSKFFKVPFFYFMDFRLMHLRFQRLGLDLIENYGREELAQIAKRNGGTYPQKCLLREVLADFAWSKFSADTKADVTQRREISSMFLTMAFATIFLIIFQFLFYVKHILFEGVAWIDLLILIPLVYIIANLLANAKSPSEEHQVEKWKKKSTTRKSYYVLSLVVICSLVSILYLNVFAVMSWFDVVDPVLLCTLIPLYCGLYWAGAFRYSHYVINYERSFLKIGEEIKEYANSKYRRILDTIDSFVPRTGKRIGLTIMLIFLAISLAGISATFVLLFLVNTTVWGVVLGVKEWIWSQTLGVKELMFVLILLIAFVNLILLMYHVLGHSDD